MHSSPYSVWSLRRQASSTSDTRVLWNMQVRLPCGHKQFIYRGYTMFSIIILRARPCTRPLDRAFLFFYARGKFGFGDGFTPPSHLSYQAIVSFLWGRFEVPSTTPLVVLPTPLCTWHFSIARKSHQTYAGCRTFKKHVDNQGHWWIFSCPKWIRKKWQKLPYIAIFVTEGLSLHPLFRTRRLAGKYSADSLLLCSCCNAGGELLQDDVLIA